LPDGERRQQSNHPKVYWTNPSPDTTPSGYPLVIHFLGAGAGRVNDSMNVLFTYPLSPLGGYALYWPDGIPREPVLWQSTGSDPTFIAGTVGLLPLPNREPAPEDLARSHPPGPENYPEPFPRIRRFVETRMNNGGFYVLKTEHFPGEGELARIGHVIYAGRAGSLKLIEWEGAGSFFLGNPELARDTDSGFFLTHPIDNFGSATLFRFDGGGSARVIGPGDPLPGLAQSFNWLSLWDVDDSGRALIEVRTGGLSHGLWEISADGTEQREVVRFNTELATSAGSLTITRLAGLSPGAINVFNPRHRGGHTAFVASYDGLNDSNGLGLLEMDPDGSVRAVFLANRPVEGADYVFRIPTTAAGPELLAMSPNGTIAFTTLFSGGPVTQNRVGLFTQEGNGAPRLIFHVGQVVSVREANRTVAETAFDQRTALDDNGTLHFRVWFTDGQSAVYRVKGASSPASPFIVNSTADLPDASPGDGEPRTGTILPDGRPEVTLRSAIQEANALPGHQIILFDIPGAGPHVIKLQDALHAVSESVTIDATGQPGYAIGRPQVEVNGADLGPAPFDGITLRGGNGIHLEGSLRTVVGGPAPHGNPIAGNGFGSGTGSGIYIDGTSGEGQDNAAHQMEGNWIGLNTAGLVAANRGDGIRILDSSGNWIGPDNFILHNQANGVSVQNQVRGSRNRITGNSIHNNTLLGIDLGGDGVTSNDAGDLDEGANGLQNFPELTAYGGVIGTIFLHLDSAANTPFRIELFRNNPGDPSGFGEGEVLMAAIEMITDARGQARATYPLPVLNPDECISATATSLSTGDTSEFSPCIVAQQSAAMADFGDAPGAGYRTLLIHNGARHLVNPAIRLGALIDAEPDARINPANALGDDEDGLSDEDGVEFLDPLSRGGPHPRIRVNASASGFLNAWIDFDINGDFAGANEHVLRDVPLTAGDNLLHLEVPSEAHTGVTYARFRFSSVPGLSFDGPALDGEVEDYQVTLGGAGALPLEATVSSSGEFQINWSTQPGWRYRVEFKNSLNDPVWQPMGSVLTGDGTRATHVNSAAGAMRFFRIAVDPP
jgi:hypothetical protein